MYMDKLIGNKGKEYQIKKLLADCTGRNLFYSVEHDGEHYVAKCTGRQEKIWMGSKIGVSNEISALKSLNEDGGHPNITKIIDHGRYENNEESAFFIMPYMGPRLKKWISIEQTEHDPLKLLALYKIAQGIEFFHGEGYFHADVKPSNMVLKKQLDILDIKPEDCDSVLIDFELCHKPENFQKKRGRIAGTKHYISPERFKEEVDLESDIYGFGVSIAHMLIGKKFDNFLDENFDEGPDVLLYEHALKIQKVKFSDFGKKVPQELEELLENCLVLEPCYRPRIDEVKGSLKMILENKYDLSPDF